MSAIATTDRPRRGATADEKHLLKGVPVAWPTLLLALASVAAWTGAAWLWAQGWLPLAIALPIATAAAFATFTPMHDASHRAVSLRVRRVNEVIGRVAAIPLMAPFPAFRFLHLEHHKHTNDHAHDPDMWAGRGPWFLLPLRWVTLDLHYYAVYLGERRSRPRAEQLEVYATLAGYVALAIALALSGFGLELALFWLLPARLAYGVLACFFDYLPHRPHTVRGRDDRFRATAVFRERWLTPIMLWQNYHLVHHLYPGVPFYRYAKVWRARRSKLESKGAREVSVFARGLDG